MTLEVGISKGTLDAYNYRLANQYKSMKCNKETEKKIFNSLLKIQKYSILKNIIEPELEKIPEIKSFLNSYIIDYTFRIVDFHVLESIELELKVKNENEDGITCIDISIVFLHFKLKRLLNIKNMFKYNFLIFKCDEGLTDETDILLVKTKDIARLSYNAYDKIVSISVDGITSIIKIPVSYFNKYLKFLKKRDEEQYNILLLMFSVST